MSLEEALSLLVEIRLEAQEIWVAIRPSSASPQGSIGVSQHAYICNLGPVLSGQDTI